VLRMKQDVMASRILKFSLNMYIPEQGKDQIF